MTEWVSTNGVSLRYRVTGSAPRTLVLLHEMGTALETWDDVIDRLGERCRTVSIDMRGFGLSQKVRGPITMADYVDDLAGALDGLGIAGPVDLVGAAVGGAVAMAFAATFPERVRSLTAICPATGMPPERLPEIIAAGASLAAEGMASFIHGPGAALYPPALQGNGIAYARFKAMQLSNDPHSIAAVHRMIAETPFEPILGAIRCPCLIIAGARDEGRPVSAHRATAARIPGAAFSVLDGTHFLALQCPDGIADELIAFCDL